MAAADPFDTRIIEQLNHVLKQKSKDLEFIYEYTGHRRIGINYQGRTVSYIMLDPPRDGMLRIEISKTVNAERVFTGRNLNICLRLLAAMIAAKEGCSLLSEAVNPTSLYLMTKLFQCEFLNESGFQRAPLDLDYADCERILQRRPGNHVVVRAYTRDYDSFLASLVENIGSIKSADLGGTRRKRRKSRRSVVR